MKIDPIFVRPLRVTDAAPLLAFELQNREWFERWVGPRPPGFFVADDMPARIEALLAAGDGEANRLGLIVSQDDTILGRINLTKITPGPVRHAQLGYRIARASTRQGFASRAVRMVMEQNRDLHVLTADVLPHNLASASVLIRNGFHENTPADPALRRFEWRKPAS